MSQRADACIIIIIMRGWTFSVQEELFNFPTERRKIIRRFLRHAMQGDRTHLDFATVCSVHEGQEKGRSEQKFHGCRCYCCERRYTREKNLIQIKELWWWHSLWYNTAILVAASFNADTTGGTTTVHVAEREMRRSRIPTEANNFIPIHTSRIRSFSHQVRVVCM